MEFNSSSTGIAEQSKLCDDMQRTYAGMAVRVLREPFLHFIVLGTVIFLGAKYVDERARLRQIVITQDDVHRIADNYRAQYGSSPSPQQLEPIIEHWIEQEMFYREALNLGLDQNDEIIRRRLAQKYKFLHQDLTIPVKPSEAQLLEYYREHANLYRKPETVTFTHVYYSPDLRGEEGARAAAEELASHLNRAGLSRAVGEGDRFLDSYDFAAASPKRLARVFGQEGLSEAIFRIEPKRWSEPLRSGFGWHIAYVSAYSPPQQVRYEEARDQVLSDYLAAERERLNNEAIAELRKKFRIVRE